MWMIFYHEEPSAAAPQPKLGYLKQRRKGRKDDGPMPDIPSGREGSNKDFSLRSK